MRKALIWAFASALATAAPLYAAQTMPTTPKRMPVKAPAEQVNLNTATLAELEALPGIDPATAKKIIDGRPFSSVPELLRAGVPKNTIDRISSMVTIGAADRPTGTGGGTVAPHHRPVRGMVWVDPSTKVYHKAGDRSYGATMNGKFMTEKDAIKAGYKPAKIGGTKTD